MSAEGGQDPLIVGSAMVVGFGVTGQAVATALIKRGFQALAVDDCPSPATRDAAAAMGLDLIEAPDEGALGRLLGGVGAVIPTPGLPERHPVFGLAAKRGLTILGEFDLAAAWDARPCLAVTGTDGKTTVTTLVTAMLRASGVAAIEAGNTDVPLVAAIDDPEPQVFVVEASSFRLAPLGRFRPRVGTWLNFAPDHLDVHADLDRYEAAKANLWARFTVDELAVANADDAIVMNHLGRVPRFETFGLRPEPRPDWYVENGALWRPDGSELVRIDELSRSFPHDLSNALAAAATAMGGGASADGVGRALREFRGLPHRMSLIGEADGVHWYDDSKATAPHAALTAIASFPSVVLIAGGRNKGLDLATLAPAAHHLRAVVAIGEAADEIASVFHGNTPVKHADSMDAAVEAARSLARPGDAVLLSPACASFDWYSSYGERGDDFVRSVRRLLEIKV